MNKTINPQSMRRRLTAAAAACSATCRATTWRKVCCPTTASCWGKMVEDISYNNARRYFKFY